MKGMMMVDWLVRSSVFGAMFEIIAARVIVLAKEVGAIGSFKQCNH